MTPQTKKRTISPERLLFLLAAFTIVVAGMRAASAILVPFFMSVFIGVILTPVFIGLKRRGFSSLISLLLMVMGLILAGFLTVQVVGNSLRQFTGALPEYQKLLQYQKDKFIEYLEEKNLIQDPEEAAATAAERERPRFNAEQSEEVEEQEASAETRISLPSYRNLLTREEIDNMFNPQDILRHAGKLTTALSGILSQAFIIILIVIFMLLEVALLPQKVRNMPGMTDQTYAQITRVVDDIRNYMGIKTLMSLLTGFLITVWLLILGVDYPFLLGALAFFLNYVPSIGSILAAIPGILIASLTYSFPYGILVAFGYVVINVGVSNGLEPRFLGRSLGLSPLIILISLIFWGWVLGPMGMLLSVPLTMIGKITLERTRDTAWLAMLMGPVPKQESEDKESRPESESPAPEAGLASSRESLSPQGIRPSTEIK